MLNRNRMLGMLKSDVINKISARFPEMALKWDINITTLLVCVTAIVTVTMFINTDHNSVNHLSDTLTEFKASMEKRFDGMHTDIANLPSITAQQRQDETILASLATTVFNVDAKLNKIDKRTAVIEDRLKIRQPQD